MANAVMLALGQDPFQVAYTGDMRDQLLEMFKAGKVSLFSSRPRTASDTAFNILGYIGRAQSRVSFQGESHSFHTICDCQQTQDIDNVIICDGCYKVYHMRCYLMNGNSEISKKLSVFLCYECRSKKQDYNYLEFPSEPDSAAIQRVVKSIKSLDPYKLVQYLSPVFTRWLQDVPATWEQYKIVEKMFSKYNLNDLVRGSGPIYQELKNYIDRNISVSKVVRRIEAMSLAEISHTAVCLICDVEKVCSLRL